MVGRNLRDGYVKILLTGSEGKICSTLIKPMLKEHEIIPFDLVLGDNMLDLDSVRRKADVDIIVHTAGVAGPTRDVPLCAYKDVNITGGVNVAKAAREFGCKVVFFSSMARYGVDAWMRHRKECGAVVGEDVAVPKYFPIDEDHPSILDYDVGMLHESKGKHYGISKAVVELCLEGIDHVALRLAGFKEWDRRRRDRLKKVRKAAKKGDTSLRKMWLYSVAGCATKAALVKALTGAIEGRLRGAVNVCEPSTGMRHVCETYFPTVEPADQIFSTRL